MGDRDPDVPRAGTTAAATDGPAASGATRSVVVASGGLVLAALPIFLVSGLAVQIRAELGFSEAALGAAVSGAFLTGAAAAPLTGRLADRIGPRASVLLGSALSVIALAGIAGGARSWGHVAALLAVSGLAFAVTDPGLAILLSMAVPTNRQGMAFGVKEASIPVATLAAGVAVPAIALTLGWRWAFLVGLVPLAGLLLALGRSGAPTRDIEPARRPAPGPEDAVLPQVSRQRTGPPRSALVLVVAATTLGLGAASGVGVFLTQSAVAMGVSPGGAGVLLAVGSIAGIAARIGVGVLADRDGGQQFGTISVMLILGGVTMALGAAGAGPLLVIATLGTFAAGWGWSGLLFLSLVRASPDAPGAAAGVGVAGLGAGNALGPLAFGVAAESVSYGAAWLGAAGACIVAAWLMRLARTRFDG